MAMDTDEGGQAAREVPEPEVQVHKVESKWDSEAAALRLYRISQIADKDERNRALDQEIRDTIKFVGAVEGDAGEAE